MQSIIYISLDLWTVDKNHLVAKEWIYQKISITISSSHSVISVNREYSIHSPPITLLNSGTRTTCGSSIWR